MVWSENGCGKCLFLVWIKVRIRRNGQHTPTKNSKVYHPPPPPWAGSDSSDQTSDNNRSFQPSSINFHFQNEDKSKTFLVKKSFNYIPWDVKILKNGFPLSLALKKRLWATRKCSLESVGEILWCWCLNETYLVDLLQSTIYFLRFYKTKFNLGGGVGILLTRRLEVKRFKVASLSQGLVDRSGR